MNREFEIFEIKIYSKKPKRWFLWKGWKRNTVTLLIWHWWNVKLMWILMRSQNPLVSRLQLAQRYRGFGHFLSAASSSRLQTMVGGALVRASAFRFGLGVSGATIVSGSCAHPSHSWMFCLLTSSLSSGVSRMLSLNWELKNRTSLELDFKTSWYF